MQPNLSEHFADLPMRDISIEVLSEIERARPVRESDTKWRSVWPIAGAAVAGIILFASLMPPTQHTLAHQPVVAAGKADVSYPGRRQFGEKRDATDNFLKRPLVSLTKYPVQAPPDLAPVTDYTSGTTDDLPVPSVTFAGATRVPKPISDRDAVSESARPTS